MNNSNESQVASSEYFNWAHIARMARLVFIVGLSGCVNNATPERLGQAHFMTLTCNRCHRIGKIGTTDAPDLTLVGFRHSRKWIDLWLKNPSAWKKDTTMKDFHLQEKTRQELTAYLSSLKGQDFNEGGRPWNDPKLISNPIKRGRVLFVSAGCVACHGNTGQGGYPNNNVPGGKIPPLKYASDGYSKEEMTDRIKKGRKPDKADVNGEEPLIEMPAWGQILSDDEISAVVEYIYSLRPSPAPGESW